MHLFFLLLLNIYDHLYLSLNTDGHKYLVEAEKKGASIAFVHKKVRGIKIPQINVKDTSKALLKLATKYRAQLKTQIVGITCNTHNLCF